MTQRIAAEGCSFQGNPLGLFQRENQSNAAHFWGPPSWTHKHPLVRVLSQMQKCISIRQASEPKRPSHHFVSKHTPLHARTWKNFTGLCSAEIKGNQARLESASINVVYLHVRARLLILLIFLIFLIFLILLLLASVRCLAMIRSPVRGGFAKFTKLVVSTPTYKQVNSTKG